MPGQLSLFGDLPRRRRGETDAGRGLICLAGRIIEYRFSRSRRRTLGIVVDAHGLSVRAPLRAAWQEIEAFLRAHERWVLARLEEWASAPRPRTLRGVDGEALPLFGAPVRLAVRAGPPGVSRDTSGRIVITRPDPDHRSPALTPLLAWLKALALETLAPRVQCFAGRLGLPAPRVGLSNARSRWGFCREGGAIRLNWRLVHVDPALADYVAAHEVAHLVEMNHSKRFWQVVELLYPDWRDARSRLELAGASLPVIGERR